MLNTDQHLVRRTQRGDHAAFAMLYDRHSRCVFGMLCKLTGNATEAEDLTQETFLAAYHALGSWRGTGKLGTWLCGIAFRLYASQRRRNLGRETEPLEEESLPTEPMADPLVAFTRREVEQAIEAAIAALPPISREVFVLVKVEGLSYAEAAEWLNVPLGTVQSRLWRAVKLLQAALIELNTPAQRRNGEKQDAVRDHA
jgi:RNA polymerase sigma-70 factor (ECF subfamily)